MRLHRLQIEHFRGIQCLDWRITRPTKCLVGPNDSGKTTILDAVELVLWPRWSAALDDTDFYNTDISQPIRITATVGELPGQVIREDRFGMHLQGWPNTTTEQAVEPDEALEDVLVIRLTVDADLEPKWVVVDSKGDETPIGHKDRGQLGVARIGALLDRHLGWGRGSVLSRLTGDSSEIGGQLANASRVARSAIQRDKLSHLSLAADKAQNAAKEVGVKPLTGYNPGLDLMAASLGGGVLSLHDGNVPLRRAGEGSRRLLTLAMQRQVAAANLGAVTLVDEVEHGLEPFRLRQVLRVLRAKIPDTTSPSEKLQNGKVAHPQSQQLIMTSHSPIALAELEPAEIGVVRRDTATGEVVVKDVDGDLRQVIRGVPDALMSPKVLLCEGKTEIGFTRALDAKWAEETGDSFAYRGVAIIDGGGKCLAKRASGLLSLGYNVVCFFDSDDSTVEPELPKLEAGGATIIRWADKVSIEERLAQDLPWEGVVDLVLLAMKDRGPVSIVDAVSARINLASSTSHVPLGSDPMKWIGVHADEKSLRIAIGQASKAKDKSWFKNVDHGEALGELVLKYLRDIEAKDLGQKVALLKKAVHCV